MSRFPICLALLLAATAACATTDAPTTPQLPYTLPGQVIQGRFHVEARAPDGKILQLITDTGGGTNLSTSGADKLGLDYTMPDNRFQPAGKATWPDFSGAWIPAPKLDDGEVPILVAPAGVGFDGMLGATWFADRTWEWDYPAGTLRLMPDRALPRADAAHVVKLGFQRGEDGEATTHLPRIAARIDGVELQFLFNTGATFRLNEAAAEALGDRDVIQRAGSFISTSTLEAWRERHPDWPYLEHGNGQAAMIRVPDVEIAGFHTGPVWFAARDDRAFSVLMAQWTDRPVEGALGGNALHTFRITADYTAGKAIFEQPSGVLP
ncbi:MAG: hypothetical protein M3Y70_00730 [Pseudomonadota bacterium]|nr:hypothetical protein [Pseudomonadota bacterium]